MVKRDSAASLLDEVEEEVLHRAEEHEGVRSPSFPPTRELVDLGDRDAVVEREGGFEDPLKGQQDDRREQ